MRNIYSKVLRITLYLKNKFQIFFKAMTLKNINTFILSFWLFKGVLSFFFFVFFKFSYCYHCRNYEFKRITRLLYILTQLLNGDKLLSVPLILWFQCTFVQFCSCEGVWAFLPVWVRAHHCDAQHKVHHGRAKDHAEA